MLPLIAVRNEMAPRAFAEKLWLVNWLVIGLLVVIASIGVAALYSVAGGSFEPWAERHALRAAIGIAVVLVMAVLPLRLWLGMAYPIFAIAFVLIALVPVLGVVQMGARRWISLPGFQFQPSEIMKIALVVALARYYQWLPPDRVSKPVWVALPFVMIAAPTAFVLKQPDLGTAVLFAAVGLSLMFLAGVHWAYFGGGAALLAALGPIIWGRLHDYQRKRVLTFLDPEKDPLGAGYHILQSKIALGSGGLNGKGYMSGTQSQLDFLPEKHTDFIFTMFAEEMGFAGSLLLLTLYGALILLLLSMAVRVRNQFSRLLIAGATVILGVYVIVNVAMVTGLAPVVGVPLPLVSYGGTAMTTLMIAIGLAMCAFVHRGERIRREDMGRW
jgi:rod shape determining protein RodA